MTAWTVLVGNSTLPDNGINTSWDHLNNQQGGGGGGTPYPVYLIQTNDAEVDTLASAEATTELTSTAITVTEANITDPEILTAEVITTTSAEIWNGD